MKYLIWLLFISAIGCIILGYSIPDSHTTDTIIKAQEMALSKKLIGFGVLGLFFIVFPLFSYYHWKDKKASDYMLTKENMDKMRSFDD
jgi:hypothetical protein